MLTFVRVPCTPTLEEFYGITSRRSRDYIRALPIRKRRPFTALFPKASPDAIDFLQKTLVSSGCFFAALVLRCITQHVHLVRRGWRLWRTLHARCASGRLVLVFRVGCVPCFECL